MSYQPCGLEAGLYRRSSPEGYLLGLVQERSALPFVHTNQGISRHAVPRIVFYKDSFSAVHRHAGVMRAVGQEHGRAEYGSSKARTDGLSWFGDTEKRRGMRCAWTTCAMPHTRVQRIGHGCCWLVAKDSGGCAARKASPPAVQQVCERHQMSKHRNC